eukprot:914979-Prymnesium_polylepis.1
MGRFGLGGFGQLEHRDGSQHQPLEAGVVYSFDHGGEVRLGRNNSERQLQPRIIEVLRGVTISAIAAGSRISLTVAVRGAAYGWGYGGDARLGLVVGGRRQICVKQGSWLQLKIGGA